MHFGFRSCRTEFSFDKQLDVRLRGMVCIWFVLKKWLVDDLRHILWMFLLCWQNIRTGTVTTCLLASVAGSSIHVEVSFLVLEPRPGGGPTTPARASVPSPTAITSASVAPTPPAPDVPRLPQSVQVTLSDVSPGWNAAEKLCSRTRALISVKAARVHPSQMSFFGVLVSVLFYLSSSSLVISPCSCFHQKSSVTFSVQLCWVSQRGGGQFKLLHLRWQWRWWRHGDSHKPLRMSCRQRARLKNDTKVTAERPSFVQNIVALRTAFPHLALLKNSALWVTTTTVNASSLTACGPSSGPPFAHDMHCTLGASIDFRAANILVWNARDTCFVRTFFAISPVAFVGIAASGTTSAASSTTPATATVSSSIIIACHRPVIMIWTKQNTQTRSLK